jgi:tetratricopeptide (TPR) repeat protein
VSDSTDLFDDLEEDDDIVAQRLRRASTKARRSARKAAAQTPQPPADVQAAGAAPSLDDRPEPGEPQSAFEIDGEDDDIVAARNSSSRKDSSPDGSSRQGSGWLSRRGAGNWGYWIAAVCVGVLVGLWWAGRGTSADAQEATSQTAEMSAEQATARITQLRALIETDPEDMEARMDLGWMLYMTEDLDGAYDQWSRVVERQPENQEAWIHLGQYYLATGDADQAREAWNTAVGIDAASVLAQGARDMLTQMELDLEEAASTPSPSGGERP